MDLDIAGRRALVLGGSAGLGLSVASALGRERVELALVARDAARLAAASESLSRQGCSAIPFVADIGATDDVEWLINEVRSQFGAPDIIITNCGGPPPGSATEIPASIWRQQFDAMVMSAIAIVNAFIPDMRRQQFGRIVMIGSTSITEPIPGISISNALRAALANWARTLSAEVAADGITVNTLMPGRFNTQRTQRLNALQAKAKGLSADAVAGAAEAEIPIGRYGEVEEFGAVAAFLASRAASYVTGTVIAVDGGLLRGR